MLTDNVYKFDYETAFCRNIGLLTANEQQQLRCKRIAIAGMGGVGGVHLLTLARLGIGGFTIADNDQFELANFNRQAGASMTTLYQDKVAVMEKMALEINPELEIKIFPQGVTPQNIDAFLEGVDLYIDGLDFFVLELRAKVFKRCEELGIPAITVGPVAWGAACLVFLPDKMHFEEYFRFEGLSTNEQAVQFLLGLTPNLHYTRLIAEPTVPDLIRQRTTSTIVACHLSAGVAGVEAVKILLGRGKVTAVPHYQYFDSYSQKYIQGWMPYGNCNPIQRIKRHIINKMMKKSANKEIKISNALVNSDSEIEKILDLARWAPSGDNTQPWRFKILDDNTVIVEAKDDSEKNILEFQGIPLYHTIGCLLESIRIAATKYQRNCLWKYDGKINEKHIFTVKLHNDLAITIDPLCYFLEHRSVDRFRYKISKLTKRQKAILEETVSSVCIIKWYDTPKDKITMAKLNMLATRIRISIPEMFTVHSNMIDWEHKFSNNKHAIDSLGANAITKKLMKWAMQDWRRVNFLNKYLGGSVTTPFLFDFVPGYFCGAQFLLILKPELNSQDEKLAMINVGEAIQRFWLTATKLGLVMQPAYSVLAFSYYAKNDIKFTTATTVYPLAKKLADKVDKFTGGNCKIVFSGRIGKPLHPQSISTSRSLRLPLMDLLIK